MKLNSAGIFFPIWALLFSIPAGAVNLDLPEALEQISHNEWLLSNGAEPSPYSSFVFGWYESQKTSPLPRSLHADPDRILVSVAAPQAEASRVEAIGDVPKGTTYGLESYALVDAGVKQVLETILFRWGKPIGQPGGTTFSYDTIFGYREDNATPVWGEGAYRIHTVRRNGGIARDTNDLYVMFVRGDEQRGYQLIISFLAPFAGHLSTPTMSYVSILYIRPTADGKTDYRASGFLTGQDYSIFGLEHGRRNFGFNATKIREGLKEFLKQVESLRRTGAIPERRPR